MQASHREVWALPLGSLRRISSEISPAAAGTPQLLPICCSLAIGVGGGTDSCKTGEEALSTVSSESSDMTTPGTVRGLTWDACFWMSATDGGRKPINLVECELRLTSEISTGTAGRRRLCDRPAIRTPMSSVSMLSAVTDLNPCSPLQSPCYPRFQTLLAAELKASKSALSKSLDMQPVQHIWQPKLEYQKLSLFCLEWMGRKETDWSKPAQ